MSPTKPAGNAKHQAAVTATTDRIGELRSDIAAQLKTLMTLVDQLEDLADTKQSVGLGFQTAEMLAARGRQDAADRAAARGIRTHTDHSWIPGLAMLRGESGKPSGPTPAPVTMAPVNVLAEITFSLQHHVRRLGKKGLLVALEAEQTEQEDAGVCTYPPRAITQLANAGVDENGGIPQLAERLAALVEGYAKRAGLEWILRELDTLEDHARDVIDGPAKTSHPDPCPWCGRTTLAVHHREAGRSAAVIRCIGTHPCECDYEHCDCHRAPTRNRHEWVNSGRAARTWTELRNLQNSRKELARMETLALDAIERVRALHTETPLYPFIDECTNPNGHAEHSWIDSEASVSHICIACEPITTICAHCANLTADEISTWPCPTIQTIDGTLETTEDGTDD